MSAISTLISSLPIFFRCLSVGLLIPVILLSGCKKAASGSGGQGASSPLEVSVLKVASESVTLSRELPGRISSYRIAEVRARINGIVQKRLFTEGADVEEGDVLFIIDPAPYQAALESARANLARAEATLTTAKVQAERFNGLVKTNAISKQSYDDAVGKELVAKADVEAAQAALQLAEINLGYTQVTAPISGRIGRAAVTEGAYVQQGTATLLATIQQLDPLYLDLNQPVSEVLRMKKALASGRLERANDGNARLEVILDTGDLYEHSGSLEFTDVSVNPTTSMLNLRGVVPNPNLDLLPGMFVRARFNEGTDPNAILIPQSFVSRNTKGEAVVLVVGNENTVESRILETGQTVGNQWLVRSGLVEGDRVITDNQHKIQPGMPVKVISEETVDGSSQPQG